MALSEECTFHKIKNTTIPPYQITSSSSDAKYIFLYIDEIVSLLSPDGICDIAQNGPIIVMNDIQCQWLEY